MMLNLHLTREDKIRAAYLSLMSKSKLDLKVKEIASQSEKNVLQNYIDYLKEQIRVQCSDEEERPLIKAVDFFVANHLSDIKNKVNRSLQEPTPLPLPNTQCWFL